MSDQAGRERFIIDHGVIHDLKTGKHVVACEAQQVSGTEVQETCDALNAMEAAGQKHGGVSERYLDSLAQQAALQPQPPAPEQDSAQADAAHGEYINGGPWIGCQMCDVIFPCYEGKERCMRLAATSQQPQMAEPIESQKNIDRFHAIEEAAGEFLVEFDMWMDQQETYPDDLAETRRKLNDSLDLPFDHMEREIDVVPVQHSAPQPQGAHRVVPVEPTEAMLKAGVDAHWPQNMSTGRMAILYRAMLSAAPACGVGEGWRPMSEPPPLHLSYWCATKNGGVIQLRRHKSERGQHHWSGDWTDDEITHWQEVFIPDAPPALTAPHGQRATSTPSRSDSD